MATTPLRVSAHEARRRAVALARWPARLVRPGLWGAGVALIAGGCAVVLAAISLHPQGNDMLDLAIALAEAGALALALGLLALDVARLRVMRRVWLKLALPPVLAALVIAATILLLAHDMFISDADSKLLLVFLVFAVALALALAGTLATGMGREITALEQGARRIAEGEYAHRVPVPAGGTAATDELDRLAEWFNLMAARVQEAFARREAAEAERKHVIAALSHDLRTPVTSLRAMLEAIGDGVAGDPATVERYHRTMRAEVLRLSSLMDELFEMARLDAGGVQLRLERMGIEDLISDALEAFHESALQCGVTLSGQVAPDLPPVLLDPSAISRALANVLQNALRYTPRGGAVVVRGRLVAAGERTSPSALAIEVADTGPGIRREELTRIFERGYRGETARDRAVARSDGESLGLGAGLGLAIARALVHLHGGRVGAVSPVPAAFWCADAGAPAGDCSPRGTLVTIVLPVTGQMPGYLRGMTPPAR
jgi:signal transduction histidine kinase